VNIRSGRGQRARAVGLEHDPMASRPSRWIDRGGRPCRRRFNCSLGTLRVSHVAVEREHAALVPVNSSVPTVPEDMRQHRVRWRRDWRWAVAVLATGLILLVGVVLLANHYSDASDALRDSGVHTTGTVTRLGPDTGRSSGYAMVSYEHVDLGADVHGYHLGQHVAVYYDPSRPTRMTIDSEDNQPGWTVLPMIVMLVVGVLAVGVGAFTLFMRVRIARLVRGAQWSPTTGTMWQPSRGRQLVVLTSDGQRPPILRTTLGSSISVPAGRPILCDISDTKRPRSALLRPADGPVVLMRRPRSSTQHEHWSRVFAGSISGARGAQMFGTNVKPKPAPGTGRHQS
jgi:Protein of unknown function (DUF3592)